MANRPTWEEIQKAKGVPLIERTYRVLLPSGALDEVNRFDYNLKMSATQGEGYIQTARRGGWIKVKNLIIIKSGSKIPCLANAIHNRDGRCFECGYSPVTLVDGNGHVWCSLEHFAKWYGG